MDRDVLDTIEREIDQEVRARFPGTAVRQAVLLQYGDDPEIEPGDLWVRVLLDADRPEDYEETLTAFDLANKTAREQFTGYLAATLREISAGRVHVQQQPRHPRRPRAPREQSRRGAAAGHPGAGARRGHPAAGPAGTGWPGNAGHADHGGNRGHPRGGHPVGPGPHPRAASLPAAPRTEKRSRQAQERVLRQGQITDKPGISVWPRSALEALRGFAHQVKPRCRTSSGAGQASSARA